ncbi:MAG: methionine--tRNA ligase [Candidatus Pacebacteria bacterium]|nr:methionine--tRNA ligase [Candidatus Paceibacterota bacterium]
MKKPNFYITTTLPYVNAEPHIGFGLEITAADVIARYMRQSGHNVIFNTGTDEHGQKIYEKALENNQTPQEYTDFWAAKFENLKALLDVDYTHFIRTTDKDHKKAAQEFWRIVNNNGYIYKKMYKVKYCVGCELEKQDSELTDGRCPLHPNKDLELREEENYFFKFSAFQDKLTELYENNPDFVKPEGKFNEIKSFVKGGLKDFSISRLKEKMPWGVEVPTDPDHVMYVWFDALVNYISTLGWPNTEGEYKDFWPGVQIAGKDNLRQQSAMWQAMLLAADLPPSKQILINGFVSIDGQKMSKSLGNVISPQEMVDRYGTDGTRFLLMFLGPIGSDMDTSWEKLDTAFTAHLSNGIGNLCSRVAKMCEKAELSGNKETVEVSETVSDNLEQMNIKEALETIIKAIGEADGYLSKQQPWTKSGDEQKVILNKSVTMIKQIATDLLPFMPKTAQNIVDHFSNDKIVALKPLFPRLSK